MKPRIAGFTLVELLIAGFILLVLLGALGAMFVSSRRAYSANEFLSTERQSVQAVTELLQYEFGMAGYRCVDSPANVMGRVFPAQPVSVIDGGAGPDTFTIRYYEDRFVLDDCEPQPRVVTFHVEDSTLWRTEGGMTEAAVIGVTDLQLTHWLASANYQLASAGRPPDDILAGFGITFVLETGDGRTHTQPIVIGLKNPQCPTLADCI